MPKIRLKPNSPEFDDGKSTKEPQQKKICEMPGCTCVGEYKAPKDRSLKEYYWFCYEHVQEYNKAWNFFQGMSLEDIETHINKATVWDRPTRRYDTMANTEELKRKAWQTYHFTDELPPHDRNRHKPKNPFEYDSEESFKADSSRFAAHRNTPEFDALALMGLNPPLDLNRVKSRYKELVKKYHPDQNGQDKHAEEMMKKINMAYTVLKLAYQKFETYEDA
jgi:hypothetical protein